MRAADMFAGWGGFSLGARMAGVDVVWAANHWPLAVEAHALNHPTTQHVCQDLNQANFNEVPDIDLIVAGPSCPGWSQAAQPARKANPLVREAHNALRSNVWAVVACVEAKLPQAFIVENVVDLKKWPLLPVWLEAFRVLGYSMEQHELCASHFGVPQRRTRLFIVGVRNASPLGLVFPRSNTEEPIGPYLDLDEGTWTPIADATPQVKARIAKARARGLGEVFLTQHVTGHPGVPLHEPMRTITTKDQWAIVRGDEYRPMSVRENARGMGFPDGYQWPSKATRGDQILGLGNAVAPPLAWRLISEVQRHL